MAKKEKPSRNLNFDEEKHEYSIGGTVLTSATGFIKSFFEPFAKDEISQYIAVRDGRTQTEVLREWEAKMNRGNKIHELIENQINSGKVDDTHRYQKEVADAISFIKSIPHKKIIPEMKIHSEDWNLAGTIDVVLENSDGVTLIDWKTTGNLKLENSYQQAKSPISHLDDCNYVKFQLQLNLYKALYEKQYGKKVTNMYFVVLSNQFIAHPSKNNVGGICTTPYEVEDLSHEINQMLKFGLQEDGVLRKFCRNFWKP